MNRRRGDTGHRRTPSSPSTLHGFLDIYGLSGSKWDLYIHSGRSRAQVFRLVDAAQNRRWILKKTSMSSDWIMRATMDFHGREQIIARVGLLRGEHVKSAAVGGFREGPNCYTLMQDVSDFLIGMRRITEAELHAVIEDMAALHAIVPALAHAVPWCPVQRRLSLLSQRRSGALRDHRPVWLAHDIGHGWSLFFDRAPRRVAAIIQSINQDFGVLDRALQRLPRKLLHGDLKFDNVGLDSSQQLWLIDWAMSMYAPAPIELGWFMAINSKQIDCSLDDVVAIYCKKALLGNTLRPRYKALSAICGLLLRGWRKALDADRGDASEMQWWCKQVLDARELL